MLGEVLSHEEAQKRRREAGSLTSRPSRDRIWVVLDIFGRLVPVEFYPNQIEKAPTESEADKDEGSESSERQVWQFRPADPQVTTTPVSSAEDRSLKIYILVKESVPVALALVALAHASLAAYLKYQDDPAMKKWIDGPLSKAICKVSDEEFEQAKSFPDHVVITEPSLQGIEVALAFKPRQVWPREFKFYRMYG